MTQSERVLSALLVVFLGATTAGGESVMASEDESEWKVAGLVLHLVLPEQFKSETNRVVPLDASGEVLTKFAIDENECKVRAYINIEAPFGEAEFAELDETIVDSLVAQGAATVDKWLVEKNGTRVLAATVTAENSIQALIFRSYRDRRIYVNLACPASVGLPTAQVLVDEIVDAVSRATTPEFRVGPDGKSATVQIP